MKITGDPPGRATTDDRNAWSQAEEALSSKVSGESVGVGADVAVSVGSDVEVGRGVGVGFGVEVEVGNGCTAATSLSKIREFPNPSATAKIANTRHAARIPIKRAVFFQMTVEGRRVSDRPSRSAGS